MRWLRSLLWFCLILSLLVLHRVAVGQPEWVERWYATACFPTIQSLLSGFSSLFPISLSECLLFGWILWGLSRLLLGLRDWHARRRSLTNLAGHAVHRLIRSAAVLYLWFLFSWGFNYARSPLSDLYEFDVTATDIEELIELGQELIEEAERLRIRLEESDAGTPVLTSSLEDAIEAAWERAGESYAWLAGGAPLIRPAGVSSFLTMAGISGIYSPFTGEGHYNAQPPAFLHPHTICHEGAHARGFAREDEANFIAFLVCRASTEDYVRYSGYLHAFLSTWSALLRAAPKNQGHLTSLIPESIQRDLNATRAFWSRKRSRIERAVRDVASRSNDRYLKVHGQSDGVESYGRVVDLLLAERRLRSAPKQTDSDGPESDERDAQETSSNAPTRLRPEPAASDDESRAGGR
ncbi:MAG: hypothetical protein ACI835_002814 [Planctomycetota bacterium]